MLRHGVYMFFNLESGQVADMIGRDLVGKLEATSAALGLLVATH